MSTRIRPDRLKQFRYAQASFDDNKRTINVIPLMGLESGPTIFDEIEIAALQNWLEDVANMWLEMDKEAHGHYD